MNNFGNHQDLQELEEAVNNLNRHNSQVNEQAAEAAENGADAHGAASSQAAFNANGDPNDVNANISADMAPEEGVSAEDLAAASSEDLDPQEYIADLNGQIATLQGQLEVAKAEQAKLRDQMLRAVAEADNVRKRAAQDVERERKYALEKFIRSLLPIYDALEKAVELTDKDNEATKATYEGVVNTLNLYVKEMSSFGVEIIDPTGQPFDPNFHQAVTMVPNPDLPNNQVMNTMQKGFLLNGRVVRPAMVIVSKQP